MRTLVITVLILVVLGLAGEAVLGYFVATPRTAATSSGTTGASQAAATAQADTITVMSEGQVQGSPDVAYLNLGVQTMGSTAHAALSSNSAAMQKVVDRLKALGETDNDLQTQGLNVFPITGPQQPGDTAAPEQIRGYRASNSLNVTINDINQAGAILDAAVQAGANASGGIRFGLKDDSKLHQDALKQAAQTARGRADAIAQALGVRITALSSISEDVVNRPLPAGVGGAAATAASVPVQPGQLTVTAQVRAVYAYAR